MKPSLTQEQAKELFEYKDGALYWKKLCTNKTKQRIGEKAGYIHKHGYRIISFYGKQYKAHRLMFLYHHGYIPEFIDHINGDRADNRIENLREVTRSENQYNKSAQRNRSGYRGVTWHQKSNKWAVRVMKDGKSRSFGYFDDLEFAGFVAEEARRKLYGEFAFENRKGN